MHSNAFSCKLIASKNNLSKKINVLFNKCGCWNAMVLDYQFIFYLLHQCLSSIWRLRWYFSYCFCMYFLIPTDLVFFPYYFVVFDTKFYSTYHLVCTAYNWDICAIINLLFVPLYLFLLSFGKSTRNIVKSSNNWGEAVVFKCCKVRFCRWTWFSSFENRGRSISS